MSQQTDYNISVKVYYKRSKYKNLEKNWKNSAL